MKVVERRQCIPQATQCRHRRRHTKFLSVDVVVVVAAVGKSVMKKRSSTMGHRASGAGQTPPLILGEALNPSTISFYASSSSRVGNFQVTCRMHDSCKLRRNNTTACGGRPLGFLVSWLLAGADPSICASKEDHWNIQNKHFLNITILETRKVYKFGKDRHRNIMEIRLMKY